MEDNPMNFRQISAAVVVMALCALALVSSPSPQGALQGKDIAINDDDKTMTLECKGGAVIVNGDDNTLTMKDDCSGLTLNGDDNTINARTITAIAVFGDDNKIAVETVSRITTTGDDNTITWKNVAGGKSPQISKLGDNNTIKQAN